MSSLERIEDELARQSTRLAELNETLKDFACYLDHVHTDVVGLRESMRLYNPTCYEAAADETPAPTQEEE